jgi:selenocysteine lyase/cysteine desulfurase
MPKLARLYLDTARLGLMSPGAQLAARDFARLAGEGVSTLYTQRFLKTGFERLDARLRRQLPGLASWRGLAGLHNSVRQLIRLPADAPIYFGSCSTALLRRTCSILCARCRNVLVADTLWPPYRQILAEECTRQGCRFAVVPIRDDILHGRLTAGEAIGTLTQSYQRHGCDSILLSSISHDGIRFPVTPFLRHLREFGHVKLVVIDGAQELAHAPVDLKSGEIDVYLAGCHKWLGAHMPLGMCCLARPATSAGLAQDFQAADEASSGIDPLSVFLAWMQGRNLTASRSETVNLMPLVTTAAALDDLANSGTTLMESLSLRQTNAELVERLAARLGWVAPTTAPELRCGILLLQSTDRWVRSLKAEDLQARMDAANVTFTTYEDGLIRLSLPNRPLNGREIERIQRVLVAVKRCGFSPRRFRPPTNRQQTKASQ